MSKGSGMGQKRQGERQNKGMDKCDGLSHGKQCGKAKEVSKGNKHWKGETKTLNTNITNPINEDDELYL